MKRTIGLVSAALCGIAVGAVAGAGAAQATPGPWSVAPFQLPADAPSGAMYSLGTSHCTPAGPCVTPGSYFRSGTSGPRTSFVATVTNGVQTATDVPLTDTQQGLAKAACSAAGACAAIGVNFDNRTSDPVLAVLTPSGWQVSVAPKPAGSAAAKMELGDVACGGADCYAVGIYAYNTTAHAKMVVEHYTNGQWKVSVLPAPSGATGSYLSGQTIACASATRCVTTVVNNSVMGGPIAGVWNGTRWTTSILPLPSDAVANGAFGAASACAPDGSCHVLSDYRISSNAERLVDWVKVGGGSWRATALPNLVGTSAFGVTALQCVAADSCSAVAGRLGTNGGNRAVVAVLSAGGWSLAYAPVPGQPQQYNHVELDAMACVPADGCTAFGTAGKTTRTAMETTVSSTPISTAIPAAPGAPDNTYLRMTLAYYDGAEEVVFGYYLPPGGNSYVYAVWTRTI